MENFNYHDYFSKILSFDSNCISTFLDLQGLSPDSGANFEKLEESTEFKNRRKLTLNSKIHEFIGRLNVDVFNMQRFLCNNVDVRIVLTLENPSFYIMEKGQQSILKIHEAYLGVTCYTVNPSILLNHHQLLQKGGRMVLPYRRVNLKSFTIPPNIQSTTFDNVFVGQVPSTIVIGIVPNQAFSGNREKNPYNLNHHNVNSVGVYLNNQCVTGSPITTDYASNQFSRAYMQLFAGIGKFYSDNSISITMSRFKTGFCLLPFSISPMQADSECFNAVSDGIIKVEIKFGIIPSAALTVLVWAEFNGILYINKNYEVTVE